MAAHSRFGGSTADRWMNCAGSTALIATVPPKPSSSYAAEGTAAHTLAYLSLSKDLHPSHYLGEMIQVDGGAEYEVTQEMVDAVVVYCNAVTAEMARTKGAALFLEQKFVLDVPSAEPGEVFGANDAMVYHPSTGRLVVFDYKHGVGISVGPEDNAQLKFYATGAVFSNPTWKLSELELVIVQPRSRDADPETGGVKRWTMDILDLMEFQQDVDAAIADAKDVVAGYSVTGELIGMNDHLGDASRLEPGSWCRWCDAASVCPARERAILETAQLDYADMTEITAGNLPDPRSFDTERLGQILKAGELLNAWLNQVQEYVEALLLAGTAVPGWKVVEKIGRAKWTSADEDVSVFAEMVFGIDEDKLRPRKLTTIGDAEKLLKGAGATKEQIDDFKLKFTIKESSGLTIAPASDRREAVNAVAADFGSVKAIAPPNP